MRGPGVTGLAQLKAPEQRGEGLEGWGQRLGHLCAEMAPVDRKAVDSRVFNSLDFKISVLR